MILLIITNVLYALGYPLSKVALDASQPFFLLSVRMLLGGVILLFYRIVIQKKKILLSRAFFWQIASSGLLSYYLANILSMKSLETISATRAALLENFTPVMSAVLEFFIFKDRCTLIEWTGIAVITLGTMPMCAISPGTTLLSNGFALGDVFAVASDLAGIFAWMCMRRAAAQEDYDPLIANTIGMMVGGTVALIHSFCIETWNPIPTTNFSSFLINTALMLIIYNLLVDNLYACLARRHTVTIIMLSGFTVPTFVAIFDRFIFKIPIPTTLCYSTAFVIAGLILFNKETIQKIRIFSRRIFRKKPA